MKLSKTKKALIIVLIIIVVAIVAIKNMKVPEVTLAEIDFSTLADGTYPGTYVLGPVKASVEVDILGGIVTQIRMTEHRTGQGQSAVAILDSVIASQSLQVDIITGATWSSNTILKAIEDALKNK